MSYLNLIGLAIIVVIVVFQHFKFKDLPPKTKALADLKYAFIKLGVFVFSFYYSMTVFKHSTKQIDLYNLYSPEDIRKIIGDLDFFIGYQQSDNQHFYDQIGYIIMIVVGYGSFAIYRFAKSVVENNQKENNISE